MSRIQIKERFTKSGELRFVACICNKHGRVMTECQEREDKEVAVKDAIVLAALVMKDAKK